MSYRWPNQEMVARGTMENFLVGLPIAFFSGLGVAVSLLDEQVNSLVGVAISASLLPPAVNAGILWVAYGFFENNRHEDHYDVGDYDLEYILSVTRQDFRRAGGISLMLTLANILLVVFASMLMFRLKEKLPIKKKVFWEVGSCFEEVKRRIGHYSFLTLVIPSFHCSLFVCRYS
jgi:hypothetical protein